MLNCVAVVEIFAYCGFSFPFPWFGQAGRTSGVELFIWYIAHGILMKFGYDLFRRNTLLMLMKADAVTFKLVLLPSCDISHTLD